MANTFNQSAFDVFHIEGVQDRMAGVREYIQPVFRLYGRQIADLIETELETEDIPVHVAQHIQRKVHPPENTWVAIGGDNRGYKKYPHFEIAINQDYVTVNLAFQDKLNNKVQIAQYLQSKIEDIAKLPDDFIIIPDHMALDYEMKNQADLSHLLDRLETVKKAEFMLGRLEQSGSLILNNREKLSHWILDTVELLVPLYKEVIKL